MPRRLNDWLTLIQNRHPVRIELGLDRCRAVWQRMGRPRPGRRIFTVAGTNGKGTTVAGIEALLRSLGRRTGSYTSPHLFRYNERVRLCGAPAADVQLIDGFEAVEGALGGTSLTYFEFGTLAAFHTLSRHAPDDAVLEVGLGGRLDAVNLLDADCGVLTAIDLDHQDYLGDDRESIGREKAGIMRSGQTVICSDREPPASVLACAEALDATFLRIGEHFDIRPDGAGWRYAFGDAHCRLTSAMPGMHQGDNLAAALTAVLATEPAAASRLDELAGVLAAVRLRGRLERLPGRPELIVDVGHNPLAAQTVRNYLDRLGGEDCRVVLGMLRDKDAEAAARRLDGRVTAWYCAGLGGDRGQSGADLAQRIRSALPAARVQAFGTVAEALSAATHDAGPDGLVIAFGSFLTAAAALSQAESVR